MSELNEKSATASGTTKYKGIEKIPFLRNAIAKKIFLAMLFAISLIIFIVYYKGDNPHYIALVLFAVTYALLYVTVRNRLYARDVRYFVAIGFVLFLFFGAIKQYTTLWWLIRWQKSSYYLVFGLSLGTLLFVMLVSHRGSKAEEKIIREHLEMSEDDFDDDSDIYVDEEGFEIEDEEREEEALRLSFAAKTDGEKTYSFDDPFYREAFKSTTKQILGEIYEKFGEDGIAQNETTLTVFGCVLANGMFGDGVFDIGLGKAVSASVLDYIYSRYGKEPSDRKNRFRAFSDAVNGMGEGQLKQILASPYSAVKTKISPVRDVDICYFHRAYHAFCKMADGLPAERFLSEKYWRRVDSIVQGLDGVGVKVGNAVLRKMEKATAVYLMFSSDENKCFGNAVSYVLTDSLVTANPKIIGNGEMSKKVAAVYENALEGMDTDAVSYLKYKIGG